MVAEINIKSNVIDISNYIKSIEVAMPNAIQQSLARVSAFGVKQITDKTQSGKTPDGGRFIPYSKQYKQSKEFKKKTNKFVDLTLSGNMFRSLTFKATRTRGTLFFRRETEDIKAFKHDTGVGKLPVRPFFAIGRRDEDKIRKLFLDHLSKGVKIWAKEKV